MILDREAQTSFARGMRDSAAPTEYAKDELASLLNGRPSRVGNSIRRRGGSLRTHSVALNGGQPGYGAIELYTAARDQRLVVVAGGKWYESSDQGESWTEIASATGYGALAWKFVIMRVGAENRVLGANGGDHPVSWNGAGAVTELTEWPAGIKHLAVMNDRLYGSDGSITVIGSKVGDPATLATAEGGLNVKCQSHDGDPEVTGLWTHGLIMLAFKRGSVGYLDGYGFNTLQVQSGARGLSRSVGCIAHRSIAPAGDGGVCWLSERGVEYLAPGSLSPVLVSGAIQGFMDTLDLAGIRSNPGLPCAIWWQRAEEYWLAVPSANATQNTHIIVFRPPLGRQRPPALWLFPSAQTASGGTLFIDEDGILQFTESLTRSKVRIVNGILELDQTTGSFVKIDGEGLLQLAVIETSPVTLFVADKGAEHERPYSVGSDGFVRELEVGKLDDVAADGTGGDLVRATIRSRPFVHGDPLRRKKPAHVRLSAIGEEPTTQATVRLIGDGAQFQERTVTIPRGSATRPRPVKVRMGGGKAAAIQVEVEFTDQITLEAIEELSGLLDEVP